MVKPIRVYRCANGQWAVTLSFYIVPLDEFATKTWLFSTWRDAMQTAAWQMRTRRVRDFPLAPDHDARQALIGEHRYGRWIDARPTR